MKEIDKGREKRGRRRKQLLDDHKERRRYWNLQGGSTASQCLENSASEEAESATRGREHNELMSVVSSGVRRALFVTDLRMRCPARRCDLNRLTPNDPYMGRTAPLTAKRCILYIYSTNIGTEYFKHALYSPFFFSSKCGLFRNANLFGSCIIHILYIECAKIKKK